MQQLLTLSSQLRLSRDWLLCLIVFLSGFASLTTLGLAAEPDPSENAVTPAASVAKISLADLTTLRTQIENAEQLGENDRPLALELCDKAVAKLTEAQRLSDVTEPLRKELLESTTRLEELQSELSADDEAKPVAPPAAGGDDVRAQLARAEEELNKARENEQLIASEIDRRQSRRQNIPQEMSAARQQLAEIEQSLKAGSVAGDSPELTKYRQIFLLARREFRQRELESLEQEIKTFEGAARVWLLRHDVAERQLKLAQRKRDVVLDLVSASERRDADKQAKEARKATSKAHPAVKGAAATNSELADQNRRLVIRIESTRSRLQETRELEESIRGQLQDLSKRTEMAKNSPAIGMLLRSQLDNMPALGPYRKDIRKRRLELSELGLNIYEWEAQRRQALDIDAAVGSAIDGIHREGSDIDCAEAEEALRSIFTSRAQILVELISNASAYATRLEELDAAEKELIHSTEQLSSYIAEQVLWIRSAPAISRRDVGSTLQLLQAAGESRQAISSAAAQISNDARRNPLAYLAAAALFVWVIAARRRFRSKLQDCGREAGRTTATSFRPTLWAVAWTVALAAPIPILLGFVGWRFSIVNVDDNLLYGVGQTMLLSAAAYGMLNLVRHACRPLGLGWQHFQWDPDALRSIRHAARAMQFTTLPLLAVAMAAEMGGDDELTGSVGRIALIAALLTIGAIGWRLLRFSSSLGKALAASSSGTLQLRLVRSLAPSVALMVLALITASAVGYHYTSMQLTRRLFVSSLIVFAGLTLRALLIRWLLVSYRRLAIQRSRERRQALAEAQETADASEVVVDKTPDVKLSDVNRQARALVSTGAAAAFLIGIGILWSDTLPALGVLDRIALWPSAVGSAEIGDEIAYVTLADLLLAGGALAITWLTSKNALGLFEFTVLQRLPLDAGARYAASSITRYVIIVTGAVLSLRLIGIGWGSVQWLVAAMSVGLGFGLQEIFANFVSGLILLFERPARVGDTVTIGSITGTITKIRIRATTILDWDNRELIIPNKEFVTGNLVNWTLTDASVRLILNVGVAYGSNTRLTTELLYKVARENPSVMNEPEPLVVFSEFGESSLNFEVRMFVPDLFTYRRLRHELHLAIDDEFRQHGIEIAYPQCDLHVRSLPTGADRESMLKPAAGGGKLVADERHVA